MISKAWTSYPLIHTPYYYYYPISITFLRGRFVLTMNWKGTVKIYALLY